VRCNPCQPERFNCQGPKSNHARVCGLKPTREMLVGEVSRRKKEGRTMTG